MRLYTVSELADVTGVPRRCIIQWIHRGELKAVRDAKDWWRLDPIDSVAAIQALRKNRSPREDIGTIRG